MCGERCTPPRPVIVTVERDRLGTASGWCSGARAGNPDATRTGQTPHHPKVHCPDRHRTRSATPNGARARGLAAPLGVEPLHPTVSASNESDTKADAICEIRKRTQASVVGKSLDLPERFPVPR